MAVRLHDNIYQISGHGINAQSGSMESLDGAGYLIYDEQEKNHILIDGGSPFGIKNLNQQLGSFGLVLADIPTVLVTHAHLDHVPQVADHSVVHVHQEDHEALASGDANLQAAFLYDMPGYKMEGAQILEDGFEVAIGKTVIRAIHTPGHTPGSMCFKVMTPTATILKAGDTLWGGYSPRISSDMDRWSDSLDVLARDKFDFVTFGHGINHLVPQAMDHIDKAKRWFGREYRPTHGGKYYNIWADPSVGSKAS